MIEPIQTITSGSLCACLGAGHCTRYNRDVTHTEVIYCRANCQDGEDARNLFSKGFSLPEEKKPTLDERRANLPPKLKGGKFHKAITASPNGKLPGNELEDRIGKWIRFIPGMKTGCKMCKDLKDQMNRLGVRWCRAVAGHEYIIDQMVKNAANSHTLIPKSLGLKLTDTDKFREVATSMLDKALKACEVPAPQKRTSNGFSFTTSFTAQGRPRFITASQMQIDIKLLISKLPPDITAIAGVARSGLAAATVISMYLHLPMFTIRQNLKDIVHTGNGWRIGGSKHINPKKGKVLVVDDTVMTGNSLKAIGPIVQQELGNFITAAVYVNPKALKKPDIHAVDLSWPHLLEWNLFNSILSPNMATDFDGILCRDCPPGSDDDGPKYLKFIETAEPLYISRKTPIPLIVTARIEKYRKPTMEWLSKWGIRCNQLVMHPARTLGERNKDSIATYKARHFKQWARTHRIAGPPPLAFIESEDNQAKQIARQTGRMVICPATAKVY